MSHCRLDLQYENTELYLRCAIADLETITARWKKQLNKRERQVKSNKTRPKRKEIGHNQKYIVRHSGLGMRCKPAGLKKNSYFELSNRTNN